MTKYQKSFNYNNYQFITSVELNTSVERSINGRKFHTVITNSSDSASFYIKNTSVTDEKLLKIIDDQMKEAQKYSDNKHLSSEYETKLMELGFTKL